MLWLYASYPFSTVSCYLWLKKAEREEERSRKKDCRLSEKDILLLLRKKILKSFYRFLSKTNSIDFCFGTILVLLLLLLLLFYTIYTTTTTLWLTSYVDK